MLRWTMFTIITPRLHTGALYWLQAFFTWGMSNTIRPLASLTDWKEFVPTLNILRQGQKNSKTSSQQGSGTVDWNKAWERSREYLIQPVTKSYKKSCAFTLQLSPLSGQIRFITPKHTGSLASNESKEGIFPSPSLLCIQTQSYRAFEIY